MKDVYLIDDLSDRDQLDAGCDKPAKLAVIGHPVAHSASPQMHQAALDALAKDMRYIRVDVNPGQVSEAFKKMRKLGFIGCNVTVPHKQEALESCDQLSADAQNLSACNTVIFGEQTTGHNTDAPGFPRAIREEFSIDLGSLRVMILGAGGGAGRAVAIQCAKNGCEQITLVNRTVEKLTPLSSELSAMMRTNERLAGPDDRITCLAADSPSIKEAAGHVDLIINATSLGLQSFDPLPISESCIEPHHLVYDMIYNPAQTGLIKHAKSVGARTGNGLTMLLHQGALSFEAWFTDTPSPLDFMREGLKQN